MARTVGSFWADACVRSAAERSETSPQDLAHLPFAAMRARSSLAIPVRAPLRHRELLATGRWEDELPAIRGECRSHPPRKGIAASEQVGADAQRGRRSCDRSIRPDWSVSAPLR